MRCAYTAKVAVLLALVLTAVAVAALVTKRPMTVALVLLSVAIVLMTFDTPLSIGVCKSADMACQATAVWLRVAGGVSAVAALAGALLNPDRKRARSRERNEGRPSALGPQAIVGQVGKCALETLSDLVKLTRSDPLQKSTFSFADNGEIWLSLSL